MTWGTALGENKEEHSKCLKGDRERVNKKLVWTGGTITCDRSGSGVLVCIFGRTERPKVCNERRDDMTMTFEYDIICKEIDKFLDP